MSREIDTESCITDGHASARSILKDTDTESIRALKPRLVISPPPSTPSSRLQVRKLRKGHQKAASPKRDAHKACNFESKIDFCSADQVKITVAPVINLSDNVVTTKATDSKQQNKASVDYDLPEKVTLTPVIPINRVLSDYDASTSSSSSPLLPFSDRLGAAGEVDNRCDNQVITDGILCTSSSRRTGWNLARPNLNPVLWKSFSQYSQVNLAATNSNPSAHGLPDVKQRKKNPFRAPPGRRRRRSVVRYQNNLGRRNHLEMIQIKRMPPLSDSDVRGAAGLRSADNTSACIVYSYSKSHASTSGPDTQRQMVTNKETFLPRFLAYNMQSTRLYVARTQMLRRKNR